MRFSALILAALPSLTAAPQPPPPAPTQKITIDARGPVALVEVTRTVAPEPAERGGGTEGIYDIALPDAGALVSVEVRDGGRWRTVTPTADGAARAAELYRAESASRGVTPASEPYDDSATHRVRLLRGAGHGADPFTIRCRYTVLPEAAAGRVRLRFPAATERFPVAAEVALQAGDATDVEIAGVAVPVAARGPAVGRASTRGAWEISWAPRDNHAAGAPALEARVATAAVSPGESALGFLVRHPLAPQAPPPGSVLFLVDRSRSVGLPGLSAERDLVRAFIETLPPSTRFDALFFDRGTKRLFPMGRPATREAIEA
ncbi:MAG TPA: vWA domain-containing protein, partial [Polyangia bacterium]